MKIFRAPLSYFRISLILIIPCLLSCSCSLFHGTGDSEKKKEIRELNNKIRTEKKSAGASYKPQYDLSKYNVSVTKKVFTKSQILSCLDDIAKRPNIYNITSRPWDSRKDKDILPYSYNYKYDEGDFHVETYIYYYEDYESCSMGMENDLFQSVVIYFRRIDNCLFDFCYTTSGEGAPARYRSILWANIYANILIYTDQQRDPLSKATDDYFNWFQKDFKQCMLD